MIQFISVSADDGQTGVYFGGSQDNGTAKSAPPQGLLWNLIWGGDGGYTFDNPAQPQQYFTENPGFDIVSSNDGGQSFNTDVVDNSTIQDPTEFYVPYALSPDFSRMYVATNRVWAGPAQPASPGQGWTAISSDLTGSNCLQNGATPVLTAIAVAPSDPNTVYVGANTGALAITSNANAAQPSWIHSNNPWCLSIGAIAIDPAHPKIAYAVTQDFYYQNSDRVMVTRDGGETWQDMTGKLPNVPINSVAVDPAMPEDVFIGTDTGVFATSDGGTQVSQTTDWEPLGTGLPAAAVLQVKVAQENGASVLVAATHGRGAWTIPAVAPPNFALETDQSNYLAPVTSSQFQFPLHVKLINGSTAAVQLSCSVQNTSASCSLSQTQVSASGDVTVTVNLGANPSGEYPVQITGQDGTHQNSLAVAIDASDFQPGVSVGNGINLEFGASVNIPVTIGSTYGWTGPVALSCPNLPAGFTCSFAPASFPSLPAGGATSTLTLAATAGATATSPMQLSIAATSGQLTRTGTAPINLAHFHLTLGTMQETLVAGATSFTTTVTAQSASSSTQAITLSCNRLDTAPSQCSFNPATIQPGQTSTMTVSGLDTTVPGYVARFQLTVSGTAGSDNFVSDPLVVTVQDFNFTGDTPGRPLVAGADTYAGSFSYISNNGYSTPLTLNCTADHGVQCATSPSSVSGTGTANFTLSGLSAVAAGTTVNVTFTASNSDMTRQMPSAFEVEDFQVQSELPVIGIMPGQGKGSASITINTTGSTSFSLGQFTVACAPGLPVSCSATSTGSNTASVAIDATQYLANGAKLPVNIQLTGSITQDGTTITHTLTLPVQSADFSMTGPTDPVTVTAGKAANFTIQFNTDNAFLADVAVQCTGAPAGASCKATSAPSSVPGSTSFQVTTTARSQTRRGGGNALMAPAGAGNGNLPRGQRIALLAGLAGLLLFMSFGLRGRRRQLIPALGMLLLLLGLVSCGGGGGGGYTPAPSSGGTGGGSTPTGTPAGTSTLTITATYSATPGGPALVTHTTQVTLTVQ